ncbi:MAG: response regulator, partial [Chloroflexota bacterium]
MLAVDDEEHGRILLRKLLAPHYNLEFATTGSETLEKAAALVPDLILLDIMIPDMDGFEVCRRLRADPLLAEVPILMVTALSDRTSKLEGIKAGADEFISKPVDLIELKARIETITQLNRYRRLMVERAKFEWVIDQAQDGYLMISEKKILYANPKACRYLGIPVEKNKVINTPFLDLVKKQQYQCEPYVSWIAWPDQLEDNPRYLVRPESPNSAAFWLEVTVFHLPEDPENS